MPGRSACMGVQMGRHVVHVDGWVDGHVGVLAGEVWVCGGHGHRHVGMHGWGMCAGMGWHAWLGWHGFEHAWVEQQAYRHAWLRDLSLLTLKPVRHGL